mmetsp:Transcript_45441/g.83128  ORF Transcript_45441/g.83128 Transcript_45441/m.83128 type:complete len:103 (-) Transcript_45441:45-353(-)
MANFPVYAKDPSLFIMDTRNALAKSVGITAKGKVGKACLYGTADQIGQALYNGALLKAPPLAALKAPPLQLVHITPGGRTGLNIRHVTGPAAKAKAARSDLF